MVKRGEARDEILFRKGKIQGLNRVALPAELLEQVGMKEGDDVSLYLDLRNNNIVLRKAGKKKA